MEMHQIRYFLKVAEDASFSRAAKNLDISQPSITRAIQKLEHDLGGPLFKRDRSGLCLTKLGQYLFPNIQSVHAAAEAAKERALCYKAKSAQSVKIVISDLALSQFDIGQIYDAIDEPAGIDMVIDMARDTESEELLVLGHYDLAILSTRFSRKTMVQAQRLLTSEIVVAVPPGHHFARMESIELDALASQPMIVRKSCAYETEFATLISGHGLEHRICCRTDDDQLRAHLVQRHVGLALMPEHAAERWHLSFCRLAHPRLRDGVALATVPGRAQTAVLEKIITYLSQSGRMPFTGRAA